MGAGKCGRHGFDRDTQYEVDLHERGSSRAKSLVHTKRKHKQDSIKISGDKAVYDRKIKKTKTLVTEEEDLNAIWRTCCLNKENEELFQTVVKDSGGMVNTMSRSGLQEDMMLNKDEKAEQATLAEGKNSLFTQTNNTSQVPAKQTVHVSNLDNNSKHVDEHVNNQSSEANGQVKPRQCLENISTTDIVEAMVTKVGEDLIAVFHQEQKISSGGCFC
ncbi:hypothetical protein C2G38_2185533 [Gigaspora rosea]|uniref:Uncharacterized protein n=1 Tax=Gigaspora rosea TaxID=44941 RepID=A0A397V7Q8_9GLOM|nr:hypothetical protein C2G38_2185533 [Gigaspora rosea]